MSFNISNATTPLVFQAISAQAPQVVQSINSNLQSGVNQTIKEVATANLVLINQMNDLATAMVSFSNVSHTVLIQQAQDIAQLSSGLLNTTQNGTQVLYNTVQALIEKAGYLGSRNEVLRYLGMGSLIVGVSLITGAEAFRRQRITRAACSILGMALTSFGASQLFALNL